jgi:hypothetical protein
MKVGQFLKHGNGIMFNCKDFLDRAYSSSLFLKLIRTKEFGQIDSAMRSVMGELLNLPLHRRRGMGSFTNTCF